MISPQVNKWSCGRMGILNTPILPLYTVYNIINYHMILYKYVYKIVYKYNFRSVKRLTSSDSNTHQNKKSFSILLSAKLLGGRFISEGNHLKCDVGVRKQLVFHFPLFFHFFQISFFPLFQIFLFKWLFISLWKFLVLPFEKGLSKLDVL